MILVPGSILQKRIMVVVPSQSSVLQKTKIPILVLVSIVKHRLGSNLIWAT
jgi:hypothetical protein